MDLGRAQIAYDNMEPVYNGDLDKYVEENLHTHAEQVKRDCLNDRENEVFDVAAAFDTSDLHAIIQAVCIGNDTLTVGAIARSMVNKAIKMVAEEQLIIKFEKGGA